MEIKLQVSCGSRERRLPSLLTGWMGVSCNKPSICVYRIVFLFYLSKVSCGFLLRLVYGPLLIVFCWACCCGWIEGEQFGSLSWMTIPYRCDTSLNWYLMSLCHSFPEKRRHSKTMLSNWRLSLVMKKSVPRRSANSKTNTRLSSRNSRKNFGKSRRFKYLFSAWALFCEIWLEILLFIFASAFHFLWLFE